MQSGDRAPGQLAAHPTLAAEQRTGQVGTPTLGYSMAATPNAPVPVLVRCTRLAWPQRGNKTKKG